ncbi:UPF0175 family protein [Desulfobacterales bacterium HSG16]|nr:UPF0175 family protein [Desulfobacterales bacterium HSG16]
MKNIVIQIPEKIMTSLKMPKKQWESGIKTELALQLYREGLLSFGNARRLSGMDKVNFHYLLGEREIPRQYDIEDYKKDLENLERWEKKQ